MKSTFLTVSELHGEGVALNFSGFTNLQKAMPETQFKMLQKSGNYEIYSKDGVMRYIKDIEKALNETLEKGGDVTKEDVVNDIKSTLKSLSIVNIQKADGKTERVYMRRKSEEEIKKALDNIQYSNNFKFKKTGKEIKDKLNNILAKLEGIQSTSKEALDAADEEITSKPNEKVGSWDDPDGTCTYKLFPYQSCYSDVKSTEGSGNYATTEEGATSCRKWNELVYTYCRATKDIEKVKTFQTNLDDKTRYELSLKDLQELGF